MRERTTKPEFFGKQGDVAKIQPRLTPSESAMLLHLFICAGFGRPKEAEEYRSEVERLTKKYGGETC